jgi:Na+/H+ antiporter NhaA
MSFFISDLALADSPLLDAAKLGIAAASLIVVVAGWLVIRRTSAPHISGEGDHSEHSCRRSSSKNTH